MIGHEIAGAFVVTVIAVAVVSAFKPGSQANSILGTLAGGWNNILTTIGQGGGAFGGQGAA